MAGIGTTIALIEALAGGGGGGSGGAVDDVQVNGVSVVSGGVAEIPVANSSTLGVIKVTTGSNGIAKASDNSLYVVMATDAHVKGGANDLRPIVPFNQHLSAFYGLAKAAGADMKDISGATVGTYPEAQKSAISTMLNGSVAVSGTTPSITALSGVRYVCGEVSELTITVPESGIIDVTFESGSTPTILTVTPPTGVTIKWANGFDPTSLDANTTYEINIMDGEFGVVGSWS